MKLLKFLKRLIGCSAVKSAEPEIPAFEIRITVDYRPSYWIAEVHGRTLGYDLLFCYPGLVNMFPELSHVNKGVLTVRSTGFKGSRKLRFRFDELFQAWRVNGVLLTHGQSSLIPWTSGRSASFTLYGAADIKPI